MESEAREMGVKRWERKKERKKRKGRKRAKEIQRNPERGLHVDRQLWAVEHADVNVNVQHNFVTVTP